MARSCLFAASLGLLLLASSASAQVPQNPGGMPTGPVNRPLGMGEQDSATLPNASDQIARGTFQAATERSAARARRERPRPARPEEIVAGSLLTDSAGETIGTIEQVSADGAVVSNGALRVMVPLDAFGIAGNRLMLGISRVEFEAAAVRASVEP